MEASQQPMLDSMNQALMPVDSQIPAGLTPTWDELKNFQDNQMNFQTLSVSMDRLDLEMNPPVDRYIITRDSPASHVPLSKSKVWVASRRLCLRGLNSSWILLALSQFLMFCI